MTTTNTLPAGFVTDAIWSTLSREERRALVALRVPAQPKLCKCGTRCPLPQMDECGSALCAGR